jgi:hypothetical protein
MDLPEAWPRQKSGEQTSANSSPRSEKTRARLTFGPAGDFYAPWSGNAFWRGWRKSFLSFLEMLGLRVCNEMKPARHIMVYSWLAGHLRARARTPTPAP